MLKSLIFVFLSWVTISSAHAQRSSYDVCVNVLERHFPGSSAEAPVVCRQNSTPAFVQCMANLGVNSNIYVLSAASRCGGNQMRIPIRTEDPQYTNLNACPSQLQQRTGMSRNRSIQICHWDSSSLMQNCLADLTEKARFHSENAIQYCGFANVEYRHKIPQFVACVIDNSRRGLDVYSSVTEIGRAHV